MTVSLEATLAAKNSQRSRTRWVIGALFLALLLVPAVFAFLVVRGVWRDFLGPPFGTDGQHSGWRAMWAGDVDADGTPDILLHTPYEQTGWLNDYGRVRVLSGKDGRALFEVDDVYPWEENMGPAADVDGDGCDDVFVVRMRDAGVFRVTLHDTVFSVRKNEALSEIAGAHGPRVACNADVDGDGVGDSAALSQQATHVRVNSGADGKELYSVELRSRASDVTFVGDIDGDRVPDFAGVRWNELEIHSGADGHLLKLVREASFLPGTLDFDRDGCNDLLITRNGWLDEGAPWDDDMWKRGRIEVLSGRDDSVLFDFDGDDLKPVER